MIVKNAKYEITAVMPSQYPQSVLPEVAFVGRSNVGKSSLLNVLTNRKNLARVGSTPGMTRQINFFNIDDLLYFVDLPGYGYANVSKGERKSWGDVIETYLEVRSQLKLILMLVDVRHSPSNYDILMYEWLQTMEVPHAIVVTKLDKITKSQLSQRIADIKTTLKLSSDTIVIPVSSDKREGIEKLWQVIESSL